MCCIFYTLEGLAIFEWNLKQYDIFPMFWYCTKVSDVKDNLLGFVLICYQRSNQINVKLILIHLLSQSMLNIFSLLAQHEHKCSLLIIFIVRFINICSQNIDFENMCIVNINNQAHNSVQKLCFKILII